MRAARRYGAPVAAILDRGVGASGADLAIDGGLDPPGHIGAARVLCGPRYMVLNPAFATARRRRLRGRGRSVMITFGGGAHAAYASGMAAVLMRVLGAGRVQVASGFVRRRGGERLRPAFESAHVERLAQADVALVAGGVGLYEACCLGVPTVAVAVTPAQRGAGRAFAKLGAVVDAGMLTGLRAGPTAPQVRRVVREVTGLLGDAHAQRRIALRARRLVDGRGGVRVAAALGRLAVSGQLMAERSAA